MKNGYNTFTPAFFRNNEKSNINLNLDLFIGYTCSFGIKNEAMIIQLL